MSTLRLLRSQCLGIFYRNYKLHKLMLCFMVLFPGLEYVNLRTQHNYTSVVVLVVSAIFLTTFQSIIVINFANDRANGFLDLYASMGLRKSAYLFCQLFSFALVGLVMEALFYLVYFCYMRKLDSILPRNFWVYLLFMGSLLPMVLLFSLIIRSPDYSRGLVTLGNIFMYIYGFSYAWDNSNESVLALLMPHYHYSNFIIDFFRKNPEFRFFFRARPVDRSFFSENPKVSIFLLFLLYLAVYLVTDRLFEELDGRVVKCLGRFFRRLARCFRRKDQSARHPVANKIQMEPRNARRSSIMHWNCPSGVRPESPAYSQIFESRSREYLVLRNLWKYFANFPALSDVNIALKKGEITCLLGHNGAGKSTLINILTGSLFPSEGEILWNDRVVFGGKSQGVNELRRVGIGICTSRDILYESMTVFEHLKLASFVKGLSDVHGGIEQMLKLLNLGDFKHVKVGKLSGGCRRKLSIGLALIGDPQIVFLDEPTSSLDPVSRKEILDLLVKLKVLFGNRLEKPRQNYPVDHSPLGGSGAAFGFRGGLVPRASSRVRLALATEEKVQRGQPDQTQSQARKFLPKTPQFRPGSQAHFEKGPRIDSQGVGGFGDGAARRPEHFGQVGQFEPLGLEKCGQRLGAESGGAVLYFGQFVHV